MAHHAIAGREEELALVDRMIAGEVPERLLLLQAPTGMGKTTLLTAIQQRCPGEIPSLVIDLKGRTRTLEEILIRICDWLSWDHSINLANTRQALDKSDRMMNVIMDGNMVVGKSEITIFAPGISQELNRGVHCTQLNSALFADLRTIGHRLVLLFDTFEQCSPEVQRIVSYPLCGSMADKIC